MTREEFDAQEDLTLSPEGFQCFLRETPEDEQVDVLLYRLKEAPDDELARQSLRVLIRKWLRALIKEPDGIKRIVEMLGYEKWLEVTSKASSDDPEFQLFLSQAKGHGPKEAA